MSVKRGFALLLSGLVVAGLSACGSASPSASAPPTTAGMPSTSAATSAPDASVSPPAPASRAATSPTSTPAATLTPTAGAYVDWATYAKNPASAKGKVVLFFHATWCPICQEVERSLTSAPVPAGLTVVTVDFDNASDLRRRYGVTIQHTFVQVNPAGDALTKWSTGTTADQILRKTV